MKIDLYTYCYNDELMMPFFLEYYLPLVDRVTILEHGSTDNTLKVIQSYAKQDGPDIRVIHTGMTTWDWDAGAWYRHNIWKESSYDLIMWSDLDEIIYRHDLRDFLEKDNYDIYKMEGYEMVSPYFPKKGTSILDIKTGMKAVLMNKFLIWRPKADISFIDAHTIKPTKDKVSNGDIKVLHYKHVGVDSLVKRSQDILARTPKDSYCKAIGGNILKIYPGFVKTRKQWIAEINYRMTRAIKVI